MRAPHFIVSKYEGMRAPNISLFPRVIGGPVRAPNISLFSRVIGGPV